MLCRKPYVTKGIAHGCGQCLPCRVKKQTLWAHRIELEAMTHKENCFVTLTYNPENIPLVSEADPRGTLRPRDITLWLKRLREQVSPIKIRYFVVGEYGARGGRPHYHAVLFGLGGCHYGRTRRDHATKIPRRDCCNNCALIARTWSTDTGPIGAIELGQLNQKTANYAARYCIKKMTMDDDHRLQGRHPEFTRMSRQNGGLGFAALDAVAETIKDQANYDLDVDVPHSLLHGKKQKPLGRYLRRKLRQKLGKDENTPQITLDEMEAQMRPVREAAFNHSRSFAKTITEVFEQDALNQAAKLEIFKSKDVL